MAASARVAELRERLELELQGSPLDDHRVLAAWLNASEGKVGLAREKLRRHLEYRRCLGLDGEAGEEAEAVELGPFMPWAEKSRTLRRGSEVLVAQTLAVGRMDWEGLLQSFPSRRLVLAGVRMVEGLWAEARQEAGADAQGRLVFVLDLQGLVYDNPTLAALNGPVKSLCRFLADNYMEICQRIVVLNAPQLFNTVWRLVSPMVPQRTRAKVAVLGRGWRRALGQLVPAALLPPALLAQPPDPSALHLPQPVPKFLYTAEGWSEQDHDLERKLIPRSSSLVREVEAGEADVAGGAAIEWELRCEKNLVFGLWWGPAVCPAAVSGARMEELWAELEMVEAALSLSPGHIPERGRLRVERAGFYYAFLGNESGLLGKTVRLRLRLASTASSELRVSQGTDAALY